MNKPRTDARDSAGFCVTPEDCDDNNACTTDICFDAICINKPIPDCVPECDVDAECDDGDVCTTDNCVQRLCEHTAIDGCVPPCQTDADCDDANGCTDDSCSNGDCTNVPIPDCTPCTPGLICSPLEVVFVFDTSGSMMDEGIALCANIGGVISDLQTQGISVTAHLLGITEIPPVGFDCLTDTVVNLLGATVPGVNPTCPFPNGTAPNESWGPAVAIVAENFAWAPGSKRVIVPLSEEGPCNGSVPEGCNDPGDDRDALANALGVANANNVSVSPIAGTGASACVLTLEADLANGTGGTLLTTNNAALDMTQNLNDLLVNACEQGTPCDDQSVCTADSCSDLGQCVNDPIYDVAVECCDPQSGDLQAIDDGDDCTNDICIETSGSVAHPPADAGKVCNDGDPCTQIGACDGQGTCVTAPVDCDDGVACTEDTCLGGTCQHTPLDDLCDNSLFCDGLETCDALLGCQAGTPPDCNDAVDCTTDLCDEALDTCTNQANDAFCDNGLFCDGVETCNAQIGCVLGTPPVCGDEIACTVDTCDEQNDVCVSTPDDSLCDNGLFCDGLETCDAVAGCLPGQGQQCDDNNACTTDSCSDVSGECIFTENFEVGVECCNPLTGESVLIDDDNACTNDVCDAATGMVGHPPRDPGLSCDDGDPCTTNDMCDGQGQCAGQAVSCDDGVSCTEDSCDGQTGACLNLPDHGFCSNGLYCDGDEICDSLLGCVAGSAPDCADAIDCTVDACDENTDTCTHTPNPTVCSNGLYCDGEELCDPQLGCLDGPDPDCNDAVECTADACDEAADTCTHTPDHATCANGLFCDGVEVCDPTIGCTDGPDPDCDDGVACTIDFCEEAGSRCLHVPINGLCGNDVYCDGTEVCDPQLGCVAGPPRDCDDSVECTVDACDEVNNTCTHTPNPTTCSNELYCDGEEICDPQLGCIDGPDPDCDDGIECTTDMCTEIGNTCMHTADDLFCANGLYCDGVEVCDPLLGCIDGPDPDCDDGIACSFDSCDEELDQCGSVAIDDNCTNGLFCDGVETCDLTLDCVAGDPPDCNDQNACTDDFCDQQVDDCTHTPNFNQQTYCCNPDTGDLTALDDGDPCTLDLCDPETGMVSHPPAPQGTPCDDGMDCTTDDVCDGAGLCLGTDINTLPCTTDAECFGSVCDGESGFCLCARDLCLDAVPAGHGDADCHDANELITINVRLGEGPEIVTGGQFVIPYDPTLLDFVDIAPGNAFDPQSPFNFEIFRNIDEQAGLIVYSVGVTIGDRGAQLSEIMATITFIPLVPCSDFELCLISNNPLNTLLTDESGSRVPYESCCTGIVRINDGPPAINCPDSIDLNPTPGQLNVLVEWEPVVASDGCDGPVALECSATHSFGINIDNLISGGGLFPAGRADFACTATDSCGVMTECSWYVDVSTLNTLEVAVQLSPTMVDGPLNRCIEFELFSSCVEAPQIIERTLQFGLPFHLPGRVKNIQFKIPAGQYQCITARDPLHTLRATAGIDVLGNIYVAQFKGDPFFGGNWLLGGNLDGSHVIDVFDVAIFMAQEFTQLDPETPCGTPGPHADINGDGVVDQLDFSFVQANYLAEDKDSCCSGSGASAMQAGVREVSVVQLRAMGLADLAIADLNRDGFVNDDDITLYMRGVRPTRESDVLRTIAPRRR